MYRVAPGGAAGAVWIFYEPTAGGEGAEGGRQNFGGSGALGGGPQV